MTTLAAITFTDVLNVILLRDYNTRVVMIGTTLLGAAAGIVGTFLLLRKRALLADALSHATLPGVAGAFLLATAIGASGKSMPLLLLGATISGVLGMLLAHLLSTYTKLKDDAVIAVVLSVTFGVGAVLMSLIQQTSGGNSAGLEGFIFGKTASMVRSDAILIGAGGLFCVVACIVFFKEFSLLCFNDEFARGQGWPVAVLDLMLITLVTLVTVVGLQAVGLILVIALLVIPPAAARFWTDHLAAMTTLASIIGAVSAASGVVVSALDARIPSGAAIVQSAAVIFSISMVVGRRRGFMWMWLQHRRLRQRVERQHLMRSIFELLESGDGVLDDHATFSAEQILASPGWSASQLKHQLDRAVAEQLVERIDTSFNLTDEGVTLARRVTRNHRLWELFLLTKTDVSADHVDRSADDVEHAMGPEIMKELEAILEAESQQIVPASPHRLGSSDAKATR